MQKVKERLLQIRQKKRFPQLVALISGLLFIFWIFIPFFKTNFNGTIENVNLIGAVTWLQDTSDLLYYGVFLYMLGLFASLLIVIASLLGIFGKDEYLRRTYYAGIGFFAVKAILDVVASILVTQTEGNVTLDVGGVLLPVFSVILCVAYVWLFINFKDSEGLLFKKEETKEE